jgi:hypothetical protein
MIARGDIVWCDFNPVVGSEQAGIRPAVVVQTGYFRRMFSFLPEKADSLKTRWPCANKSASSINDGSFERWGKRRIREWLKLETRCEPH